MKGLHVRRLDSGFHIRQMFTKSKSRHKSNRQHIIFFPSPFSGHIGLNPYTQFEVWTKDWTKLALNTEELVWSSSAVDTSE